ncbi:hypothetical protein B4U80_14920 [Leptotrombidium deliense]|uniref:C2H2-type domain-containing protein n=1 Tax=Leptotrombidium deliense TaxID=299467 RepID=A0A443S0T5_9ACAR|nr:hypothetical protein B4U80_14920 [Leptotrombidium deliense]
MDVETLLKIFRVNHTSCVDNEASVRHDYELKSLKHCPNTNTITGMIAKFNEHISSEVTKGVKQYKCKRSTLFKHLANHDGSKKNVCNVCEKHFTTNTNLKAHKNGFQNKKNPNHTEFNNEDMTALQLTQKLITLETIIFRNQQMYKSTKLSANFANYYMFIQVVNFSNVDV